MCGRSNFGSEGNLMGGFGKEVLQLRAAYLSEDERANTYWSRPRPYARAVGAGRLRPGRLRAAA